MRLKMSQVHRNKKLSPLKHKVRAELAGAPSRIRTYDLWIRSPLLYPAELWAQKQIDYSAEAYKQKIHQDNLVENLHGAGDGNRTRVTSLEGWSSTIELHPQKKWSGRQDSNLRHPAPKAGALPNCATSRQRLTIITKDFSYASTFFNSLNAFPRWDTLFLFS